MKIPIFEIGTRFQRLVVISGPISGLPGGRHYQCRCDCGGVTIASSSALNAGTHRSCGCLTRERVSEIMRSHGKSKTRIYRIWCGIKRRCLSTTSDSYATYGARGITVSPEFQKFECFLKWSIANGYSDTLTIDRIDNDLGYSPTNCRWATTLVNHRNRSVTLRLTLNGVTKCAMEWSKELGINYNTIISRIRYGWKPSDVLTVAVKRGLSYRHRVQASAT